MKKIIAFILLLLIPLSISNAKDIEIENITLLESNGNTEEISPPSTEELKIYFDLKFKEIGDSAKYEVKIKNNSTKEYKLSSNTQELTEEPYIEYKFEWNEEKNIIEPQTERIFYITIIYSKEVPNEEYINNVYKNDNYMNINFNYEEQKSVNNPNTNNTINIIKYLLIIIISILTIVILIKIMSKYKETTLIIIILISVIPTIIKAIESIKIDVYLNVEIEKKEIGEFSLCGYDNLQFEKGMTFKEWFNSQYNTTGYTTASEDYSVLLPDGLIYSLDGVRANGQTLIVENATYTCKTAAECISPTSQILISQDGKTKIAKNIKESDEIAYYDFLENKIKIGKVKQVFIHQNATNFIRYTLENNAYIEATDYHPIYTLNGWKSYTNRNGYDKPLLGDKVKTINGYQKIIKIETYNGKEDFIDFQVIDEKGNLVDNYYANNILVHSAYQK
ncbi:MAG: Hint domain-containing protein [Candidatus Coprovivens sp.]